MARSCSLSLCARYRLYIQARHLHLAGAVPGISTDDAACNGVRSVSLDAVQGGHRRARVYLRDDGGAVIAWVATTIAAIVVYAVARVVYRDSGHRLIERYPALASFTKAVQTYPFRAVIIARLLPVIPQTAVNIYAGVAPVPFWTYVIASGIGKIPSILIYAYLGHGLSLNPALFGTVAAIIILLSTLLMIAYQKKGSRR